jgi:hypothetical protein
MRLRQSYEQMVRRGREVFQEERTACAKAWWSFKRV